MSSSSSQSYRFAYEKHNYEFSPQLGFPIEKVTNILEIIEDQNKRITTIEPVASTYFDLLWRWLHVYEYLADIESKHSNDPDFTSEVFKNISEYLRNTINILITNYLGKNLLIQCIDQALLLESEGKQNDEIHTKIIDYGHQDIENIDIFNIAGTSDVKVNGPFKLYIPDQIKNKLQLDLLLKVMASPNLEREVFDRYILKFMSLSQLIPVVYFRITSDNIPKSVVHSYNPEWINVINDKPGIFLKVLNMELKPEEITEHLVREYYPQLFIYMLSFVDIVSKEFIETII